ncbi:ATP-binding protein [Actinomycetes bacterium M1A6_2h]
MRGDGAFGNADETIRIVARPENLDAVHDLLTRLWLDDDLDGDRRMQFELAVAEVAANIVEHATRGELVTLVLRVRGLPDCVEAIFEDDGHPATVDLASLSMPDDESERGRGLTMAQAVLDTLVYERAGGLNRWYLVRNRTR